MMKHDEETFKNICRSIQQQADPANTNNPPVAYVRSPDCYCICGKPIYGGFSWTGMSLRETICHECQASAIEAATKLRTKHGKTSDKNNAQDMAALLAVAANIAGEHAKQNKKRVHLETQQDEVTECKRCDKTLV